MRGSIPRCDHFRREVKPIERAATAPTSSTERMSNRPWPWLRPRVDRHVAPVPAAQLSRTIDFARIALIVGLVFLHYGMYPNFRLSPFGGMSVNEYEVATFVNSFLLFSFLNVAQSEPGAALSNRIRRRFTSLYLPLLVWNLLYLSVLLVVFARSPVHPLLPALNIDFATAGPWQYFNAVFAIVHHPVAFQFWFVRDLFLTVLLSPVLWLMLKRLPLTGAVVLAGVWLV